MRRDTRSARSDAVPGSVSPPLETTWHLTTGTLRAVAWRCPQSRCCRSCFPMEEAGAAVETPATAPRGSPACRVNVAGSRRRRCGELSSGIHVGERRTRRKTFGGRERHPKRRASRRRPGKYSSPPRRCPNGHATDIKSDHDNPGLTPIQVGQVRSLKTNKVFSLLPHCQAFGVAKKVGPSIPGSASLRR